MNAVNDAVPDKPHYGFGLCSYCYKLSWAKKHVEDVRTAQHAWYLRNKKQSRIQSQINRNGEFGEALKTTSVCFVCGGTYKLAVHHLDHKGQNVPKKQRNNAPDNIQILCIRCHGSLHGKDGWNAMRKVQQAKVQSTPVSKELDLW
jgi:hypothetical protein